MLTQLKSCIFPTTLYYWHQIRYEQRGIEITSCLGWFVIKTMLVGGERILTIISTCVVPVLCLGETVCPRTVRQRIDPEFTWRGIGECVCMCDFCMCVLFSFKKSVYPKISSENFQVHVTNQNRLYIGVLLFFSVMIILRYTIHPLSQVT